MADSLALNIPREENPSRLALVEDIHSTASALQVSTEVIEEESGVTRDELRAGYGLVRVILAYVVANQYTKSLDSLQNYLDMNSEYPKFAGRVERYQQHCRELIAAIQVKKSMASVTGLSNAKQHELREKVYQHFRELKSNLDKIEHTLHELKLEDVRATVWFVKAVCVSVAVIFGLMVSKEIFGGQLLSLFYVARDLLDTTVNFLFSAF